MDKFAASVNNSIFDFWYKETGCIPHDDLTA